MQRGLDGWDAGRLREVGGVKAVWIARFLNRETRSIITFSKRAFVSLGIGMVLSQKYDFAGSEVINSGVSRYCFVRFGILRCFA